MAPQEPREDGREPPPVRAAQYVRMSTDHQQYSTENQAEQIRAVDGGDLVRRPRHQDHPVGLQALPRAGAKQPRRLPVRIDAHPSEPIAMPPWR
jgi:hypothetical protein